MGRSGSLLLQKRQRIRKPNQPTSDSLSTKPEESKCAAQECFIPGQKIVIQGANDVEDPDALGIYKLAEDQSKWINMTPRRYTILTLRGSEWIIKEDDEE